VRSRLFLCVAEEQLRGDEGRWLCTRMQADSVLSDVVLVMPPFLGQASLCLATSLQLCLCEPGLIFSRRRLTACSVDPAPWHRQSQSAAES
jgi:hypothetical protein